MPLSGHSPQALLSAMNEWWRRVGYVPSPEAMAIHEALVQPTYGDLATLNDPNAPALDAALARELGLDAPDPTNADAHPAEGPLPTTVLVAGGEQAGKSYTGAHHFAPLWMLANIGWLVGDRYEDAWREFEYIRNFAIATGTAVDYSKSDKGPWHVEFMSFDGKSHIVKTLASDDFTKLARESPDFVMMCEPGRQTKEAFEYLWRRCVPHTAPFLVAGTFEGQTSDWFAKLWKQGRGPNARKIRSLSLPSYANREIYPQGQRDPKFVAAVRAILLENPKNGKEIVLERFYGIPRKPDFLVFSEFSEDRHVSFAAEYIPGVPVYLAVDPGWHPSSYAVLFLQVIDGQVRQFDEIYVNRMTNDEVIRLVTNHYAFPDIRRVVIDIASKAHAGAEGASFDKWSQMLAPRGIALTAQFVKVAEGVTRTHDKLAVNPLTGEPYYMVSPRCQKTIWEFTEGYTKTISRNGEVISDDPRDANNHAMKALAYFIIDEFGTTDTKWTPPPSTDRKPRRYDQVYPSGGQRRTPVSALSRRRR